MTSETQSNDDGFEKWASGHVKGFVTWLFITPAIVLAGVFFCWLAFPLALEILSGSINADLKHAISQAQLMLIGMFAGCAGAYMRVVLNLPRSIRDYVYRERGTFFPEKLQFLVGMLIGVASYWILDSRFIISVVYGNFLNEIPSPTPTGVGIVAAFSGLLARELVRKIQSYVN